MGIDEASARPTYTAPAPIERDHDLDGFDCGKAPLNDWLRLRALENEGRASRTYVVLALREDQPSQVAGYYALATGAVALRELRGKYRHNLPDPVPVMVLGRLAVDQGHHGNGIGPAMLREAMQRTLDISRLAGVRMLMVHAIDDEAVAFYEHYGFHVFPTGSRTMFLPVETIVDALAP